MEHVSLGKFLTKRQGLIEEALRDFGNKPPKSMTQEEVILWLKFRAQLALILELVDEYYKGNITS